MKHCIILIALVFVMQNAKAQCEDSVVNCTGECGQFIDENDDGFCDQTTIDSSLLKKAVPVVLKQNVKKIKVKPATKKDSTSTENQVKQIAVAKSSRDSPAEVVTIPTAEKASPPAKTVVKKTKTAPYHFFSIAIPLLILYFFLDWLVKLKKITKANFLKIWNMGLLITFVVSAVLGLFLVVKINYHLQLPWIKLIYIIHVDFGVAMAVISLFHLLRHWKYYSRIFVTRSASH